MRLSGQVEDCGGSGLIRMMQVLQNQFALGRYGFWAYVLSPLPRHVDLQGKNLAIAPFSPSFCGSAIIGLQILLADLEHFLSGWVPLLCAF